MNRSLRTLLSLSAGLIIGVAMLLNNAFSEPGSPAYASSMTAELPAVGEMAPAFDLPSSTGKNIKLSDYKGKTVVVYFYPKADTPGCTTEACGFRDSADEYRKAGVEVVGISPDPVEDVKAFADKFQLNFPLLADADHKVCEAYGVWQQKTMAGNTFMGAMRTTFVVGPDGKITHVFEKVKPAGHEKEVLEAIKAGKKPA
jgi:peroxiredoxin Q/BCP